MINGPPSFKHHEQFGRFVDRHEMYFYFLKNKNTLTNFIKFNKISESVFVFQEVKIHFMTIDKPSKLLVVFKRWWAIDHGYSL